MNRNTELYVEFNSAFSLAITDFEQLELHLTYESYYTNKITYVVVHTTS